MQSAGGANGRNKTVAVRRFPRILDDRRRDVASRRRSGAKQARQEAPRFAFAPREIASSGGRRASSLSLAVRPGSALRSREGRTPRRAGRTRSERQGAMRASHTGRDEIQPVGRGELQTLPERVAWGVTADDGAAAVQAPALLSCAMVMRDDHARCAFSPTDAGRLFDLTGSDSLTRHLTASRPASAAAAPRRRRRGRPSRGRRRRAGNAPARRARRSR